jgi:hypothetical protein
MRLARAAALAVAAAVALPGCIVAIGTPVEHHDEDELSDEEKDALTDADEAFRDERLLQLEKRMERLEQSLVK